MIVNNQEYSNSELEEIIKFITLIGFEVAPYSLKNNVEFISTYEYIKTDIQYLIYLYQNNISLYYFDDRISKSILIFQKEKFKDSYYLFFKKFPVETRKWKIENILKYE